MASAVNQPFFSIIVPTYNRASQLANAIKSITSQTFLDYEVIVVDDGSTDNTKEVLTNIVKENNRINYYWKQNEERSIARNYGIARATGKYVGFLDSDDKLYSNHLSVAFELLKRNNFPEIGHLGYELTDPAGKSILKKDNFDESFKEKLIRENSLHGNAIFIRRDIAKEVNFIPSPAAILSEDWYLWLRLAARYQFHFDNTVTSAVVQHSERSLMKINPDKLIANTRVIVEYLMRDNHFMEKYKGKASYHFANHYTFLTLILSLTKTRRLDTVKFLIKAVSYDPSVIFRKRFLASIKHFL
jgi:glycosyltransferase involved in cell wall biosynthesis